MLIKPTEKTEKKSKVEAESSSQNVRAVTRAVQLLKSFAGKRSMGLAEIADVTGLDKGTARRLLLTLMREKFITQDQVSQNYSLGPAIRDLAADVPDEQDLRSIAIPILTDFVKDQALTVFLSVYQNGQAICLERLHDLNGLDIRWWAVGGSLPYNSGGAPRLLLAMQSDEEIARVMSEVPPQAMTPKSNLDKTALLKEFEDIRKKGYVLALDDVILGIGALAVPVYTRQGTFACAISIAGPNPQMVHRKKPAHLAALLEAAERIGAQLP